MKYADILDSIDYNFHSPMAAKFDETFLENSHNYYLNRIELDKTKIYNKYHCDLTIFTTNYELINYFNV